MNTRLIDNAYFGSSSVLCLYQGSELVWPCVPYHEDVSLGGIASYEHYFTPEEVYPNWDPSGDEPAPSYTSNVYYNTGFQIDSSTSFVIELFVDSSLFNYPSGSLSVDNFAVSSTDASMAFGLSLCKYANTGSLQASVVLGDYTASARTTVDTDWTTHDYYVTAQRFYSAAADTLYTITARISPPNNPLYVDINWASRTNSSPWPVYPEHIGGQLLIFRPNEHVDPFPYTSIDTKYWHSRGGIFIHKLSVYRNNILVQEWVPVNHWKFGRDYICFKDTLTGNYIYNLGDEQPAYRSI